MRCFCITLTRNSYSVLLAERCVRSAQQFGIDVEIFDAVDTRSIAAVLKDLGLRYTFARFAVGDIPAIKACFASHFLLWKRCLSLNESLLIVEHDAVFQHPVPDHLLFDGMLYLTEPYWGEAIAGYSKISNGIQDYPFECFNGTCGYAVNPQGAASLIRAAKQQGISPVDHFINVKTFPNLQLLKPALIKHENTADRSTIQFSKSVTVAKQARQLLEEIECQDNSFPADKLMKVYLYMARRLCRNAEFCFALDLLWKAFKLKVKRSQ